MLYVCNQRCKYVRQSNWDCTRQPSLIQTQHQGDRSATKRPATSFRFHPCRTRRTETLMAARDQCMACIALLNHADFRGLATVRLLKAHRWRLERRRRRRSQTGSSRRTQHPPPSCGSRHTKTGFAYTRRCHSVAGCRL